MSHIKPICKHSGDYSSQTSIVYKNLLHLFCPLPHNKQKTMPFIYRYVLFFSLFNFYLSSRNDIGIGAIVRGTGLYLHLHVVWFCYVAVNRVRFTRQRC